MTLLRATKSPEYLWIAIETAPNLPSPKCLIISKSCKEGASDKFNEPHEDINFAYPSHELVGDPNLVDASSN